MSKGALYALLTTLLLIAGVDTTRAQSAAATKPACAVALRPGRWQSNGGSSFWIQCTGTEVFWIGMNKGNDSVRQGAEWTQIGHGTVQGKLIELRWSDVPYGSIRTNGRLQLRVEADTLLRIIRDDGPFGMPRLRWVAAK